MNRIFLMNLSTGATKPKLPNYVAKGMAAIKTDEMQLTIQVCFAVGGLLNEAKLEENYRHCSPC
jgi:hypothetical protein